MLFEYLYVMSSTKGTYPEEENIFIISSKFNTNSFSPLETFGQKILPLVVAFALT